MVVSGQCDWVFGDGTRAPLQARQAILLTPGMPHRELTQGDGVAQIIWVMFEAEGIPATWPTWGNRSVEVGALSDTARRLLDLLAQEYHAHASDSPELAEQTLRLLLLLLGRCAQEPPGPRSGAAHPTLNERQQNIARSAAHYLTSTLRDPMPIAALAHYHSLTPAYFSSLFRLSHGVSPQAFLRQARLQRALCLLETGRSVKQIAAACGFTDSAHFCRQFKAATGRTPTEHRQAGPRVSAGGS